ILQNASSIFEIDTFKKIRGVIAKITGVRDSDNEKISINIIADHIKSVTFMAADGVLPSNEGRGYVLRRLLRRAARHARLIGYGGPFVEKTAEAVIGAFGSAYPELDEKSSLILRVLSNEESRFNETLDTGTTILKKYAAGLRESGEKTLSGAHAFELYDTYGFPLELTKEMLGDEGFGIDESGFDAEMQNQKARARAARGQSNYMGQEETVYHRLPTVNENPRPFKYAELETETEVLYVISDGEITENAAEGASVSLVLRDTPFYAESGGQCGDNGAIECEGALVGVTDCKKAAGNNTAHIGFVKRGTIKRGDKVIAKVDRAKRQDTARNHTATHLLQKALREVLGSHVEQSGSEVSSDRLRFDFTHFSPLTQIERDEVEARVNGLILAGLAVSVSEMPLEDARKKGATALFGEKYGETVRVVDIGGESVELCGGTHLENTQAAGVFKLLSESGVAAGIRRIEALTGPKALAHFRESEKRLNEASAALKTTPDKLALRAEALTAEIKRLQKELTKIDSEASGKDEAGIVASLVGSAKECRGFKLLAAKLDGADAELLRRLGDKLRDKLDAFVLCGTGGGAVQFFACANESAVGSGIHAGNLVKEAAASCGGGGGGRPGNAQAGGRDAKNAGAAVEKAMSSMMETIEKGA
ncbi:MAG: alanine--tRNA ligase, partial [Defluviitaleaceae bacterium]|nr:alanine--tRNA ligase [Defluviitaleaceae bacterium]